MGLGREHLSPRLLTQAERRRFHAPGGEVLCRKRRRALRAPRRRRANPCADGHSGGRCVQSSFGRRARESHARGDGLGLCGTQSRLCHDRRHDGRRERRGLRSWAPHQASRCPRGSAPSLRCQSGTGRVSAFLRDPRARVRGRCPDGRIPHFCGERSARQSPAAASGVTSGIVRAWLTEEGFGALEPDEVIVVAAFRYDRQPLRPLVLSFPQLPPPLQLPLPLGPVTGGERPGVPGARGRGDVLQAAGRSLQLVVGAAAHALSGILVEAGRSFSSPVRGSAQARVLPHGGVHRGVRGPCRHHPGFRRWGARRRRRCGGGSGCVGDGGLRDSGGVRPAVRRLAEGSEDPAQQCGRDLRRKNFRSPTFLLLGTALRPIVRRDLTPGLASLGPRLHLGAAVGWLGGAARHQKPERRERGQRVQRG